MSKETKQLQTKSNGLQENTQNVETANENTKRYKRQQKQDYRREASTCSTSHCYHPNSHRIMKADAHLEYADNLPVCVYRAKGRLSACEEVSKYKLS